MRKTAHDTGSIGAALVEWANDETFGAPIWCLCSGISKTDYETVLRAVTRDSLPIGVKKHRGVGLVIGRPDIVAAMSKATVSAIGALQARISALQALTSLIDTWSPLYGLSGAIGAPEDIETPRGTKERPWRDSAPVEKLYTWKGDVTNPPEWLHPFRDHSWKGGEFFHVTNESRERAYVASRYHPTDEEIDSYEIPGV